MEYTSDCIECKQSFKYIIKDSRSIKEYCTKCRNLKQRERCKSYKARNRDKISSYNATYKSENKEIVSEYNKKYNVENRDAIQKRQSAQHKVRRQTDSEYKFSVNMRTRMGKFMKGIKSQSSMKLLGCTLKEIKLWIEYQFRPGMTWENHGTVWHYDHVIPCAAFDQTIPEEQEKCWHWSNYQPLFKTENLSKNDDISVEEIRFHVSKILPFFIDHFHDLSEDITFLEYDREEYANL